MKRSLPIALCLGAALAAAAVAWLTAAQEHEYRERLGRGEAALAARDTFAAIEAYSGAIALHPESMLPYLRRGETYQLRGDLDSAARDLRKASELDPSAPRPLEALGNVLFDRGRYPQAAAAYALRLALDDTAPGVAYRLALARYRLGDYTGALDELDRILATDELTAEVHYLRGLCLRDAGHLDAAVEALEEAVNQSPGMIPAREELADLYGARRRYGDELEQLQVIAGLDRQSIDRQVAVGLTLARAARAARNPVTAQRNDDLAILTLSNALERAPDQPRLYGALGRVWLDIAIARDDRVALSKSLEALARVASGPAATSEVLAAYGRALSLDGQTEAAERVLEEATRRYPVDPEAFAAYAGVAETRGQLDAARRALVAYDALVDDDGTFVRRARRIASLSMRLNDPHTAVTWLDRALVTTPDDPGLLAPLAEALLQAGDTPRAQAAIAQALTRTPDDVTLRALARKAGVPR